MFQTTNQICIYIYIQSKHCNIISCRKWGAGFFAAYMFCEISMQMETKKLRDTGFSKDKKFRWCIVLVCCPPIDLCFNMFQFGCLTCLFPEACWEARVCHIVYYIKTLLRNWGTLDRIIVHMYWHTLHGAFPVRNWGTLAIGNQHYYITLALFTQAYCICLCMSVTQYDTLDSLSHVILYIHMCVYIYIHIYIYMYVSICLYIYNIWRSPAAGRLTLWNHLMNDTSWAGG